ncbi:MAG: glycosyltransferase family 2 protein [Phycisphaerales bacterium]|jgi:glycosyltransferase involved in cell wall biosynthesis
MIDVMIITRDEEANLPHCLAALGGWTRRVFVIDSGSTDGTVEIAQSAGATVIHHDWEGYARQKNWGLDNLPFESDWILILDADEVVTPALRDRLLRIVSPSGSEPAEAGYYLNRLFYFLGRPIRHCGYFPSWNLRLFRRGKARYEDRSVHEHMVVDGPVGYIDEPMIHDDRRGIEHSISKHNRYAILEAMEIERSRVSAGESSAGLRSKLFGNILQRRRWFKQRLYRLLPMPWLFRFLYMYVWKRGFLDGAAGVNFSVFISAYEFLISLRMKESRRPIALRPAVSPTRAGERDLPVTVVVPVLNEARNLRDCLARLDRFEKVVVVDSGSKDQTREIAREHGAEVVDFRWNGRFPKKRNWMLRNHRFETEWILFLDADEYVTDRFCDELKRTLPTTAHNGFWLTYHNYFLGRYLRHGTPFTKLALIRKGSGEYERIDEERWSRLDMEVHEHPVLDGTTGHIHAAIEHNDFKGLESYFAKHNEYSSWEARRYVRLVAEGRAIQDHFTSRQRWKYRNLRSWWLAPGYFFVTYIAKAGLLDGYPGFAFAMLKWIYFFHIRLKILELEAIPSASAPATSAASAASA